ncbi:LysM peptidoglycan-binding domain-containing protein [Blastococcus sp. SYSU D00813]
MSMRRLTATTAVMAAVAVLLVALTPPLPDAALLARDPQTVADTAGPETLVLAAAALLAWLAWGWGALGLLLTGLSAVPGAVGAVARGAARLLLPADARRAAALALGLGLAVGSPVLSACSAPAPVPAAAAALPQGAPVPDWPVFPGQPAPPAVAPPPPAGGAGPVPEWPAAEHVVVRGDSLWDIAVADLRARTGSEPAPAEVARAVAAWWSANADVIGPDPDLIRPGQVLRAPADPSTPVESETPG